jgi:hypothetical protein
MTRSIWSYVWASPNSVLGLAIGGVMILLGARATRVAGVLEVGSGLVGSLLGPTRIALPWRAMTLGHVILGIDESALDSSRAHEHVHVRQYERWGPFFLPAYVISSLWQVACGRRCYRDNWFERQAYEHS